MPSGNLSARIGPRKQDTAGSVAKTKVYQNDAPQSAAGSDFNTEESVTQRTNRAKRFGIEETKPATMESTASSVRTFKDVDIHAIRFPPETEATSGEVRADAILVYGVDKMSTKDVFAYFSDVTPASLEWIDDYSCVVVWDSEPLAETAMEQMSRPLTYFTRGSRRKDDDSMDDSDLDSDGEELSSKTRKSSWDKPEVSADKGLWRIGLPSVEGSPMFFRQATQSDRKLAGAANRSYFYLKYGKKGKKTQGGTPGIISSTRKRKVEESRALVSGHVTPGVDSGSSKMDVDKADISASYVPLQFDKLHSIKGEKRLKMYSDDGDSNSTVFKRLSSDDVLTEKQDSSNPTDLREMLRLKKLEKLKE